VFTKYDQFLIDVGTDLKQCNYEDLSIDVSKEAKEKVAKKIFEEHFLGPLLGDGVIWVQLEGEFRIKCLGYILTFYNRYGPERDTL